MKYRIPRLESIVLIFRAYGGIPLLVMYTLLLVLVMLTLHEMRLLSSHDSSTARIYWPTEQTKALSYFIEDNPDLGLTPLTEQETRSLLPGVSLPTSIDLPIVLEVRSEIPPSIQAVAEATPGVIFEDLTQSVQDVKTMNLILLWAAWLCGGSVIILRAIKTAKILKFLGIPTQQILLLNISILIGIFALSGSIMFVSNVVS